MTLRIEVDWAPAYELGFSLEYFLAGANKNAELGPAWVAQVQEQLSPAFRSELAALQPKFDGTHVAMLAWQCPGPRDAETFLRWLASLSPGQLYERLAPYMPVGGPPLPANLGQVWARFAQVLGTWNEQYFSHLDPAILAGLAADAEAKRALVGTMEPLALVEHASGSLCIEPDANLQAVLLVPQYHIRPLTAYDRCQAVMLCAYGAEPSSYTPGEPSTGLLRLTRALGDESRLKILRFLAGGPYTFTEVVRFAGLSKSTVHHHLATLRAAGLVRMHPGPDCGSERYSLRRSALHSVGSQLEAFIDQA